MTTRPLATDRPRASAAPGIRVISKAALRCSCRVVIAVVLITACYNDIASPPTDVPRIDAASIAANPDNVLSAFVAVRVRDTDSVAVRFRLADSTEERETAAVVAANDSVVVPVLGLFAGRRYVFRVIAYGASANTVGEALELSTGTLPPDLPGYSAGGPDPSPGYVAFAAGLHGLVIDNTGRVVWYHRFPSGVGLNFMAQPNGRYVARPPTLLPAELGKWVEVDPTGRVTRMLGCARGLQPRLHDLNALPDGSYWILCDETRTMDLTGVGGVSVARVMGTVVQHITADGSLLFEWSPFDHFAITDGDPADRVGPNVNWTHGNAIDFDTDGNLIVSFRNLGEVTKIDVRTGAVIWRLGGRRNQFVFTGTSMPAFTHQHSARAYVGGSLLLLDNIGDPTQSRAERYVLDASARSARLDGSFASGSGVVTQIGGSVQGLPGGRTLVSYGTAGRVEEYDAAGRVVWSIHGNAGYVFRAQRIQSLYAPGVGTPR